MLIKRTGYPEDSDLVLCTVTNIQHNSVFVNIHEYEKTGMIPISEIAPGRIRNIRDYVVEGKIVVCKVLKVNEERGYIDLSLRRVTEGQKRQKSDELKQEQKAEKIIELTANSLKQDFKKLYDTLSTPLLKKYFYMYQAFDDVLLGELSLLDYLDKKTAEALEQTIREKIKPKEIYIAGDVTISLWEENGLEILKKALLDSQKISKEMKISYMGSGRYRIILKGLDYKELEKQLKDASDQIVAAIKKHKGKAEFVRVKNISVDSEE